MKKAYYYFFLEPLEGKYLDNDTIKPNITFLIETEIKSYEIAIFVVDDRITMIRIMVPDIEGGIVPENDHKMVKSLKEHMQSILRATYYSTISFYPKSIFKIVDSNEYPHIEYKLPFPNIPFDLINIRNSYKNTFSIKNQMLLMSQSQDFNIPYPYRILSLYKLLELEFKEKGKFNPSEFDKFLARFEDDFKELKISNKKLKNYIHEIRDKCAHIKSNKDVLYVIEVDRKDEDEIRIFMGLLIKMCTILLNEKYGTEKNKFIYIKHPELKIPDQN